MKLIDFSQYERGNINYGGSERKESVRVPDGAGSFIDYMVKFRKKTPFCTRNNHISEYLGSRIFEALGFNVQKTYLGMFGDEEVVACKSFIGEKDQFVPFNDVGESTLDQDKDRYQYEYADIMRMLHDNSKLTDVHETIAMFWEMFVVDALIGNFDRHGLNWGFIKRNGAYSLAPVFDNGSSLFPSLVDEDEMRRIVSSKEETEKRVFGFPMSQIRLHGRKSSYWEVIGSLEFDECNKALVSVVKRSDFNEIRRLIDATPLLGEVQRTFYVHMLENRFLGILRDPYEQLTGRRI